MHTKQKLEQKISKLVAQNQSLCVKNSTEIHYRHSQHNYRLTEPAHVLCSAEDCQIHPKLKEWGVSPSAATLPELLNML